MMGSSASAIPVRLRQRSTVAHGAVDDRVGECRLRALRSSC